METEFWPDSFLKINECPLLKYISPVIDHIVANLIRSCQQMAVEEFQSKFWSDFCSKKQFIYFIFLYSIPRHTQLDTFHNSYRCQLDPDNPKLPTDGSGILIGFPFKKAAHKFSFCLQQSTPYSFWYTLSVISLPSYLIQRIRNCKQTAVEFLNNSSRDSDQNFVNVYSFPYSNPRHTLFDTLYQSYRCRATWSGGSGIASRRPWNS